jgi:hypothetical protein
MNDSIQVEALPETLHERPTYPGTIETPANSLGVNDSMSTPADLPDWLKQATKILAELPSYLGQIYQNNQGAVITLGLFFGVIVALKLTVAILFTVNEIPLLAPTLELIGIGYTVWFVSRYLLQASARSELAGEIKGLKSEILGNPEHN